MLPSSRATRKVFRNAPALRALRDLNPYCPESSLISSRFARLIRHDWSGFRARETVDGLTFASFAIFSAVIRSFMTNFSPDVQ